MTASEILVLIPCHSLEDFPTDQNDQQAASLLNAFAVAFHPALLAWTSQFPRWHRADDPLLPRHGQLIFVPTVSEDWLPHNWVAEARDSGATVVAGLSDRQEMIAAALKVLTEQADQPDGIEQVSDDMEAVGETEAPEELYPIDSDLVADFVALGTCWLLIELLTRRMRQYDNIDETRLFQRARSAADAAVADDRETCVTHLRGCFEILLEARERFYPVECYLLDLCLAVPDVDADRLPAELLQSIPFSLLVNSDDLATICQQQAQTGSALREACQAERASIIASEDRETPLPLLPLESLLFHLQRGRSEVERLSGKPPVVWGRRRFGLNPMLPQILKRFGYQAAMHVILDDGIYPDAEYTKLRWRGADGTLIDAISRIPLAADSASSYLRLPLRLSESMDHDQVAGLIFARWPVVTAPWFDDLRRSQRYAPCLGRFVTLDRFFEQTELPGQLSAYKSDEYFSPLLIQHVAREERQPISRYVDHQLRRRRLDAALWYQSTARILLGKTVANDQCLAIEDKIESASSPDDIAPPDTALDEQQQSAANSLAQIIQHSAGPGQGLLVLNSLSFTRRVVVPLSPEMLPPPIGGSIKAVELDAQHPQRNACVVEVPGCGFSWIPTATNAAIPSPSKLKMAEEGLLRNDLFEVVINTRTGGIGHVRFHNERRKRMSQQLSFRFPRERSIVVGPESDDTIKSQYAEMQCAGHKVTYSGTAVGEIQTWGELIDQTNNQRLAKFQQTVRVWRGLSTIEIDVQLSDVVVPDGDPWNNYFASRFAWDDSSAAVTRGLYHAAQNFGGERFETSDYIEVASEDERLTIVPHGLPFHRKTGARMVDAMLIVAGEDRRHFQFTVAIDAPYPLEAAWNATTPVCAVPTQSGPPRAGMTGWFFHVDGRHVQVTRITDVHNDGTTHSPLEHYEHTTVPTDPGFALRMVETEGRSKLVKLRCFRTPTFARKRDFRGQTISELIIEGDAVVLDITAFEIVDVELRFGATP